MSKNNIFCDRLHDNIFDEVITDREHVMELK